MNCPHQDDDGHQAAECPWCVIADGVFKPRRPGALCSGHG